MTHEPFNAATACFMPLGVQVRMDPWRAISPPMCRLNPLDSGQQSAIGRFAWTFRPAAPCVIPRRGDAHHIDVDLSIHRHRNAHDPDRKHFALIFDKAEFHFGASEKMRSVFFKISRSMRRRSFSRRRRAFSTAKSVPAGGTGAWRAHPFSAYESGSSTGAFTGTMPRFHYLHRFNLKSTIA